MKTLLLLQALGGPASDKTLRPADGVEMAYVEKGTGHPVEFQHHLRRAVRSLMSGR